MNKKLRQQVYDKYRGKCAYTGIKLEPDWQVDHVKSKHMFEQVIIQKEHYKHILDNTILSIEEYNEKNYREDRLWKYYRFVPRKTKPHPSVNYISNLLPAQKIINHYKRSLDLEGFREYMLTFYERLNKLPKTTQVEKTKQRIIYMNTIADMFNIRKDIPFNGKFYFETL